MRIRETIITGVKTQVLHILSVCVFFSLIQHAMRMRHIIICDASSYTIFFFTTNGAIFFFWGGELLEVKFVLMVSTKLFILRITE